MTKDNLTHDCEIMGPDTEYQTTIDYKTGTQDLICIWCEMAKKIKGNL